MKIKILIPAVLIGMAFFMLSFQSNSDWPVPEKYQKMKNPVAADDDSVEMGEDLWKTHCKACHGKEGLGDGSKAAQLDTPAGDFTVAKFQKQTDGALFYKTLEGKGDMPSYKKKIPNEEDLWNLVNFMRTLAE
ncbi:MAG: cytochrome c [Phaeodactylibacter sp.]|nr:cytochrome c [Phaeodactylibacter sp.]